MGRVESQSSPLTITRDSEGQIVPKCNDKNNRDIIE